MRGKVFGAVVLGVLALAAGAGYEASRAHASEVVIVVTNEVRGRDRRCGCQGAAGPTVTRKAAVPLTTCSCKMITYIDVEKSLPDLGALPERSAWLARLREQVGPLVCLDTGDLLFSRVDLRQADAAELRRRAELLVDAYGVLGVSAYTPGELDFALGRETLASLLERARFTTVSANLANAKTHVRLFAGHTIVRVGGGSNVRLGVVGVFAPPESDEVRELLARESVEALDPVAALAPEVESLRREGVDLVVLLAHAPDVKTREIVQKVPGIDIAYASHAEVPSDARRPIEGSTAVALALRGGGAPIFTRVRLTPGARGVEDAGSAEEARLWLSRLEKQLADYQAQRASAADDAARKAIDEQIAWTNLKIAEQRSALPPEPRHDVWSNVVPLDAHIYDHGQDPDLQRLISQFKHEVENRRVAPELASQMEEPGRGPAGEVVGFRTEAQCAQCHEKQAKVWAKSPHAKAWAALERAHDERDPECVRCHSIGLRAPGGFADVSRVVRPHAEHPEVQLDFRNVQCEACHGPRLAHPATRGIGISLPTLDVCRKCHDAEHDPYFSADRVAKAIAKGKVICTRN